MHFPDTRSAWRAIKAAKLDTKNFILSPDNHAGQGWVINQHDRIPLTVAQRAAIEKVAGDHADEAPAPVARVTRPTAPVVKAAKVERIKAERAPSTRVAGATGICRELAESRPETLASKETFVAACAERGVGASTAGTQWYRLRAK